MITVYCWLINAGTEHVAKGTMSKMATVGAINRRNGWINYNEPKPALDVEESVITPDGFYVLNLDGDFDRRRDLTSEEKCEAERMERERRR